MNVTLKIFLLSLVLMTRSMGQWAQTSGPTGNEIARAFSTLTQGDTILVGLDWFGICRSTDSGKSWTTANSGLPETEYYTYQQAYDLFQMQDTVLAATGNGIYRTTDWGSSWSSFGVGLPDPPNISKFVRIGDDLICATYFGVYRSSDNGREWTISSTGLPKDSFHDFYLQVQDLLVADGLIIAGTYDGIYRSLDSGTTWTESNVGIPNYLECCQPRTNALAVLGSTLFAGTDCGGGLFRSDDFGASWELSTNGLPTREYCSYSTIWSLGVSGGTVIAGTVDGVFRSTDYGESWITSGNGFMASTLISEMDLEGDLVTAASLEGVFRTNDEGITWVPVLTEVPRGLPCRSLAAINEAILVGGGLILLHRSTDYGVTWSYDENEEFAVSNLLTVDSLAFGYGTGIFVSTDSGISWDSASTGLPRSMHVESLSGNDTKMYAGLARYSHGSANGGGVYTSIDNGNTWVYVGLEDMGVSVVASLNGDIFAGAGYWSENERVYVSHDEGTTWTESSSGLPDYLDILVLKQSNDNLVIGTSKGAFLSSNSGLTWSDASDGLPQSTTVNDILAIENVLIAGTRNGVYVSRGFPATWVDMSIGLIRGGTEIYGLLADHGLVYAATDDGVWIRSVEELTGIKYQIPPTSYRLYQNYPNPFNPSTTITFSVPRSGEVSLRIFNLLGEEVATLYSGIKDLGTHEVQWNPIGKPSGVYFYRLPG